MSHATSIKFATTQAAADSIDAARSTTPAAQRRVVQTWTSADGKTSAKTTFDGYRPLASGGGCNGYTLNVNGYVPLPYTDCIAASGSNVVADIYIQADQSPAYRSCSLVYRTAQFKPDNTPVNPSPQYNYSCARGHYINPPLAGASNRRYQGQEFFTPNGISYATKGSPILYGCSNPSPNTC